jgi:hypothetical protein
MRCCVRRSADLDLVKLFVITVQGWLESAKLQTKICRWWRSRGGELGGGALKTALYIACLALFSLPLRAQVQHGNRIHLWDRGGFTITFVEPKGWTLSKDDRRGDRIIYPQGVNFVLLRHTAGKPDANKAEQRFVFVSTQVRGNLSFDGPELASMNLEEKRFLDSNVTMTEIAPIHLNGKVYRSFEYFMPYATQTERVTYVEFSHGVLGIGISSTQSSDLADMSSLVEPLIKSLKIVEPESWRKR